MSVLRVKFLNLANMILRQNLVSMQVLSSDYIRYRQCGLMYLNELYIYLDELNILCKFGAISSVWCSARAVFLIDASFPCLRCHVTSERLV